MTAREPSAVEVIAEGLHAACRLHGLHTAVLHLPEARSALAALKAAGFVVATRDEIRAMSVQEQAELIGGQVQPCSVNPECGHHVRIVREVRRDLIDRT